MWDPQFQITSDLRFAALCCPVDLEAKFCSKIPKFRTGSDLYRIAGSELWKLNSREISNVTTPAIPPTGLPILLTFSASWWGCLVVLVWCRCLCTLQIICWSAAIAGKPSTSQRSSLTQTGVVTSIFLSIWIWLQCHYIQERKSSPKSKFWGRTSGGRPRGYPGGRPGAKTSVKPSKSWKNKHFGADIHDPKARTSMTAGGFKKTSVRKTSGWIFVPYTSTSPVCV